MALMSFAETIAAGRAFARKDEPRPDANRELLALGLSNVTGGMTGALPSGGGTSQTAVNHSAGARTQLAALATAAVAAATMLFRAPLMGLLPHATLACVVLYYSLGLIKPHEFRAIRRVRHMEFRWALVAFVGVVALGTLQGILVAILVSLLALLHQSSTPPVLELARKRGTEIFRSRRAEHPDDETFPGLLILQLQGRIYFGNAAYVGEKVTQKVVEAQPQVLLVDMSAVPDMEYSALKMLIAGEERFADRGVQLWFAAFTPEVLQVVKNSTLWETLGRERMHFTVPLAVERFLSLQQKSAIVA
jgi:SulP family sulfate permease